MDPQTVTSLPDRFLSATSTRRQAKHRIDDTEYLEMVWRMIRALEIRTIENPELLPQIPALVQRLSEVVNVAVAANAERFAIDPMRGASMLECARVMGISKQSASERRAKGKAVMLARIAAAGVVRFAEARREKEAISAAAEHAVTNLAEYRARHLRSVA